MGIVLVEAHYMYFSHFASNSFICNRVEALHLLTSGSNANTVISGGRDGLIKYWNINRLLLTIPIIMNN